MTRMKTLVVGVGALGGVIAARMLAHGHSVSLATRDAASAKMLRESGLHVSGISGDANAAVTHIAPAADYASDASFDLIVLATKAHAAIELAPMLCTCLTREGVLLPIQNGGVPQMLAEKLGDCVLGGLSNLGATMTTPGRYVQRNAGHILIGEFGGGESARALRVRDWLGQAVEIRVSSNLRGAVWSKLLLNCSVTTLGAVAGCTMREYIASADGRALFDRTYDEALNVAIASGARPERMLVDPIPPSRNESTATGNAYEVWLETILANYGDLKPSMLQDFERGRRTEIDFINGYVADLGDQLGVLAPINATITRTVHAITRGELAPHPTLLTQILRT